MGKMKSAIKGPSDIIIPQVQPSSGRLYEGPSQTYFEIHRIDLERSQIVS